MINVNEISKSYGKKQILKSVSFSASPGEQISIIGSNGCGKSTLIKIMAGLIKPNNGNLEYFNVNMLKHRASFSKICGYVPQDDPLLPELTVEDNLSVWSGKLGHPEKWLTEMFELDEILKTRVSKLSGGMRRRVSIACAVASKPKLLLMDEPVSAQDIYYQKKIHSYMKSYTSQKGIIILATHDFNEIAMSDRCYIISEGTLKLIEDKSFENINKLFEKGA